MSSIYLPPRAGHTFAWDDAAAELMPVNPHGPGLLPHARALGVPLGGDGWGEAIPYPVDPELTKPRAKQKFKIRGGSGPRSRSRRWNS